MQVTSKLYEVYPCVETTQYYERWKEEYCGRPHEYRLR